MQGAFSYIEPLKKQIENDIAIVQEQIDGNQSTIVFEEADRALQEILDEEEKKLYFEDGHSTAIMNFYRNEFCGCYQKVVKEFLDRQGYRSDEYMVVCYGAAVIYRKMAVSLTWADQFDLATDLLKKALQYAKKSEDQELIGDISNSLQDCRKVLTALEESKRQRRSSPSQTTSSSTNSESENESGGCLLIIGLAALGAVIGGPFGFVVGLILGFCLVAQD